MQKHISIVSPVYRAEKIIPELVSRISNAVSQITDNYEIILVDDCSSDNSWQAIEFACKKDSKIKGIKLSRNFGQHYAITAGLDYARGEWVVVMDCDLQDAPEEISKLYAKAIQGHKIVFAQRAVRKDGFFKKLSSRLFYLVFNYFTETKYDHTIANFGIYSQQVIGNFRLMKEQNRAFPLFIQWLGFQPVFIEVEHSNRFEGKSSYTFSKLVNLAIDVIVAQSNKPLKISIKFGIFISLISFLIGLYFIIKYFIFNIHVAGFTSVIVTILFVSGLIFANFGLLGLYIGKVFNETKGRPLYVVDIEINNGNN